MAPKEARETMDLPPIRRKTLRRLRLLVVLALAGLWTGIALLAAEPYISGQAAYRSLMAGALADGVDWDGLMEINQDTRAVLIIDGAPAAYPVVTETGKAREGFYAAHDFWGRRSPLGCPHMEEDAADAALTVVEGNAIGHSDKMLSSLTEAVDAGREAALALAWATPGLGAQELGYSCELTGDGLRLAREAAGEVASVNDLRGFIAELAGACRVDQDAASSAVKAVVVVARAGDADGARERAFLFMG